MVGVEAAAVVLTKRPVAVSAWKSEVAVFSLPIYSFH